jgi:hypothetical protein
VRPGLAVVVLVLNVVALISILGSPARVGRKVMWCAAVVILPLVGAAVWLLRGRTAMVRHGK